MEAMKIPLRSSGSAGMLRPHCKHLWDGAGKAHACRASTYLTRAVCADVLATGVTPPRCSHHREGLVARARTLCLVPEVVRTSTAQQRSRAAAAAMRLPSQPSNAPFWTAAERLVLIFAPCVMRSSKAGPGLRSPGQVVATQRSACLLDAGHVHRAKWRTCDVPAVRPLFARPGRNLGR